MYDHQKASQFMLREIRAKAVVIRYSPSPTERMKPADDGFLVEGDRDQSVEFELAVAVPKDRNVRGIVVRSFKDDKPIVTKKNQAGPNQPYYMFTKTIRSRTTQEDSMSTKHDVNNIRLVFADNGLFQMWEMAIPTRITGPTANYFLTVQRLYLAHMYNLNGQIYIPEHEYSGYQKWTGLQSLLSEMVRPESLAKLDQPLVRDTRSLPLNGSHRVMFFCLASGTGMAETSQGPAFIHWQELPQNRRFSCVNEGQLVGGEIVATDKGLQLKNIHF